MAFSADRARRQGELFGDTAHDRRPMPAAVDPSLRRLGARLPGALRLGTSSWSFPGWRGIVYARDAAPRSLARDGLAAYAAHPLLGGVGLDRTWYAPLDAASLRGYAEQVPIGFRFLVKAHLETTSARIRDGAGTRANARCLDPAYAADAVVAPAIEGLAARAGALLFQFTPGAAREHGGPRRLIERLHRFLDALPRGPLYAVEIRDPALAVPDYFDALAAAGARHCLSVHPAIDLEVQVAGLAALPPGALIVRWNLGAGLRYEEARARYAPFDRLRAPDPARRERLAALCADALANGRDAFVIANNKAEGSAPLTITALARSIDARLGADDSIVTTAAACA